MKWSQLKEFCNSLTEDQLEKNVILWREDEAIGDIDAFPLEEDHYTDEDNDRCYPESEAEGPVENLQKAYSKGDPILWENF